MKYYPEPVPYTDDLPYIREWLGREFSNILVAFEGVEMIQLVEDHIAPTDPRQGMIKFADGVNWNPGGGQGFYGYDGTGWVKLDDLGNSTGQQTGNWTPVLTFATPGDVSVAGTLAGSYVKNGKMVTVWLIVSTSTFTHTTAAGEFRITGLPFTAAASSRISGSVELQGFNWPGGATQVTAAIPASTSYIRMIATGSGLSRVALTAADHPSGTNAVVVTTISYEVP